MLTHLGSNQDSAEPKSDVLPITPWVNRTLDSTAKLENFLESDKQFTFLTDRLTARAKEHQTLSVHKIFYLSHQPQQQRKDTPQAI